MVRDERRTPDGQGYTNGSELTTRVRKEIESLGSELWRGAPLAVANHVLLHNGETRTVPFLITPGSLLENGMLSADTLRAFLSVHMRSRYAHLALDVPEDFTEPLIGKEVGQTVRLEIANHGSHPVVLEEGHRPLHLFVVPPKAHISGERLESVFGKDIQMLGKKGDEWERYYEYTHDQKGRLKREFRGVFMKIDPDRRKRFWMPDSGEPISLSPSLQSYRDVREYLFGSNGYFAAASEVPIPEGHLWIGQLPQQRISPSIYGVLSRDAYIKMDGQFVKINNAFQTQSPLIEGRVAEGEELAHHVEIKGAAEWVLVTYAQGKVVAG